MSRNNHDPFDALARALTESKRILIAAHVKPDGDALGSVLALQRILRAGGKVADAFLPDPIPAKFAADAAAEGFLREADFSLYDAAVLLDTPRRERLALGSHSFEELPGKCFAIDHHGDHELACTLNFAEKSAATALHVLRLARCAHFPVDATAAQWLLTALMTDTGCFRFSNADSEAFRAAAELVEAGADPGSCANRIFFNKPLNQQLFEADMVLHHRRFYADGRISIAVLTRELLDRHHFDMRDGEGLIDLLREIEGVMLCCLIYPVGDGCKLSLRSGDVKYPIVSIAHEFGGGGHALAAGVLLRDTPPAEAEQQVLQRLEQLLENPL